VINKQQFYLNSHKQFYVDLTKSLGNLSEGLPGKQLNKTNPELELAKTNDKLPSMPPYREEYKYREEYNEDEEESVAPRKGWANTLTSTPPLRQTPPLKRTPPLRNWPMGRTELNRTPPLK
jgi:hypothetical protein